MRMLILLALLLLGGCNARDKDIDGKLHCTTEGNAYALEVAVGTLTYVRRMEIMDPLCKKEVK